MSNETVNEERGEEPVKPPTGIMPVYIWKQKRAFDLINCLSRFDTENMSVEDKWLHELEDLLPEIRRMKPKVGGVLGSRPPTTLNEQGVEVEATPM